MCKNASEIARNLQLDLYKKAMAPLVKNAKAEDIKENVGEFFDLMGAIGVAILSNTIKQRSEIFPETVKSQEIDLYMDMINEI